MQRWKQVLGRFAGSAAKVTSAREFHSVGLSLSKLGRWDDALQEYKRGLALAPHDVELWRALLCAQKTPAMPNLPRHC